MKELVRPAPVEMARQAPQRQPDARHMLQPQSFAEARALASAIAGTPFAHGMNAEGALAAMVSGSELGLTAMQSLRAFSIIKGKPTLGADAMVAIVRASGLCESWETVESTPQRCTISTRRKGSQRDQVRTWTAEDAKRAKLNGDAWGAYPAQMLRHRCATDLARDVYPDVLLGVYAPEEFHGAPRREDAEETTDGDSRDADDPASDFSVALRDCDGLRAAGSLWQRMSRDLHAADATEAATAALADWATDRGYDLVATEQHSLCTGTWTEDLCRYLDGMSVRGDAEAVRAHYHAHRGGIDTWTERDRTVARRNTVRAAVRLLGCTDAQARQFLGAQPTPPGRGPGGARAPGEAANDGSGAAVTGDAAADATASRDRVASKGGPAEYAASKKTRRELENAVRAHGRYIPELIDAAVARLDAITSDSDGARIPEATLRGIVETWAAEGPAKPRTHDRAA